ncbi:MAG: GNAT family N-acetyltransferase [Polyangiaceae bacterium]|nr:GNAT family N-acetyltransferase [Polyangiaceae bacterium]
MEKKPSAWSIRPAAKGDLVRLGQLAGQLVRMHHATDPRRFFLVDSVEEGYASWFSRELGRKGSIVLVAEQDGVVIGYGYATIEGQDWSLLLEDHGAVHDIFIDASARGSGVGEGIVRAICAELEKRGAERIVLNTMVGNESAQRLFERCGFRKTMIEMTRG